MLKRRRRSYDNWFRYDISVSDWHTSVSFNDYAYFSTLDTEEFEERIDMVIEGRIVSTNSKKCKGNLAARVSIRPGEFWYDKSRLRKDVHTIGHMYKERADHYLYREETLSFWISIPTKSYENIKDYLTYKGKALLTLVGTELFYRRGDIYYLGFEKLSTRY